MGYIYQADVYCDVDGSRICDELRARGLAPEDEMDQAGYDSGDFPKSADIENGEADTPQHCAACQEFLHNPLTGDGYRYVKDALDVTGARKFSNLSPVLNTWAHWYNFSYWDTEDVADSLHYTVPGWYSREAN